MIFIPPYWLSSNCPFNWFKTACKVPVYVLYVENNTNEPKVYIFMWYYFLNVLKMFFILNSNVNQLLYMCDKYIEICEHLDFFFHLRNDSEINEFNSFPIYTSRCINWAGAVYVLYKHIKKKSGNCFNPI